MNQYLYLSVALLLSASLCASPGWAAEDGSFPGPQAELRSSFAGYIDASHKALSQLDGLSASGKIVKNQWAAQCRLVKTQLNRARAAAIKQYNRGGGSGGLLPDDVLQWYQMEYAAWNNIESIGSELISLHDVILDQTTYIGDELLPAQRRNVEKIKALAGVADKVVGKLVLDSDMNHARAANQQKTLLNKALADCGRVLTGIDQVNTEAKAIRTKLERSNYRSRLEAIARKKIDPDQSGVFVKHEQKWEQALSQALQSYDEAYKEYVNEVQAVESLEILAAYTYLKSMPKTQKLQGWLQSLVSTAKEDLKPKVYITSNRIPSQMQFGEEALFEVMVNNSGANALPAGWSVECDTERAPSGASGNFEYVHARCPAIPPGRALRLTQRVTAPPGVGAWELRWTVKSGGKTLNERKAKVTVRGAASASFGSVTGPREIRQGRSERLSITVENTGDTPIQARDLSVEVRPTRSPSGYRPARNDFSLKLRPRQTLGRGDDLDFRESLSAPQDPKAVGKWELEVQLKLSGRVIERRKISLEVEAK